MVTGDAGFAKTFLLADRIRRHAIPSAPVLIFPKPYQVGLEKTVMFTWNPSTMPRRSSHLSALRLARQSNTEYERCRPRSHRSGFGDDLQGRGFGTRKVLFLEGFRRGWQGRDGRKRNSHTWRSKNKIEIHFARRLDSWPSATILILPSALRRQRDWPYLSAHRLEVDDAVFNCAGLVGAHTTIVCRSPGRAIQHTSKCIIPIQKALAK